MEAIAELELEPEEAVLWPLGQAGYVARAGEVTLAIDPYLTDSVGRASRELTRRVPAPMEPEELKVDIFVVTHDHLDHLDPETIGRYRHRETTTFVGPRFAARKLAALGVPEASVVKVDVGETVEVKGVMLTGVFALPTDPGVLDTAGYLVRFANGRSFYHASDTSFCDLLLKAAPRAEVLLVPINGKWGNLGVEEAVALTGAVRPRFVSPNHWDLMEMNSGDPEAFRERCGAEHPGVQCVVLETMKPFGWR